MSNAKRLASPGLFVALFALALAPVLMSPGPAVAQTPQQADLFGSGLQEGDVVAALIDGVVCGTHTVSAEDDGGWYIVIMFASCDGGAVAGARVTFTVNGVAADQYVRWEDGYVPPDRSTGIVLTVGGTAVPVDPDGPPEPPSLSHSSGLAIFSGGSIEDLEAAASALCPGGAEIWVNEPSGNGYLLFVAKARFDIVNTAFRGAYSEGFDGLEPVIVNGCKS